MQYLLGISYHASFSHDILKLLVSDQFITRVKHINTTYNLLTFQPDNLVLAKDQVQVQSGAPQSTISNVMLILSFTKHHQLCNIYLVYLIMTFAQDISKH